MQLTNNTSVALPFLVVPMIFMWDANVFFLDPSCVPHLISRLYNVYQVSYLNLLYMLIGGVQIFFGMQNLWMPCLPCPISTISLVAISWIVWGVHFFLKLKIMQLKL